MPKKLGSAYFVDEVLPQIKDHQWAAVLNLAGYSRRGDPVWDKATKQLECVVRHQRTKRDVSITVRASYAHKDDGEFYVLAEPFKSSEDGGSASHHALYKGQPKQDAIELMKSIAKVLRLLA